MPATDATELDRIFREESGRVVATLVRLFGDIDIAEEMVQEAFAVAAERWPETGVPPNPGGWLTTTARNRAIDRLRREASRDDRHAQSCAAPRERRAARAGGRRERRPAPTHLHLLPPGPRPERADRPHAATPRRARDAVHRPGVPGARGDDGQAARSSEAEDPRRQDPVPGSSRGRAPEPVAARARGHLPDLQRGLHRHRRRRAHPGRPVYRSDPARAHPRRPDARRARGARPARTAPADRVPTRGAHGTGRRRGVACRTRTVASGTAT